MFVNLFSFSDLNAGQEFFARKVLVDNRSLIWAFCFFLFNVEYSFYVFSVLYLPSPICSCFIYGKIMCPEIMYLL